VNINEHLQLFLARGWKNSVSGTNQP
jgi:hypothetical protein